jgi:spore maturation protein A
MHLNYVIGLIYAAALVFGAISGRIPEVSAAAIEGAASAVDLVISLAGMICLWAAVMEVMNKSGVSAKLAGALSPLLNRLYPRARGDRETMEALSNNVSANLLGLGNAATPAGIKAALGLKKLSGGSTASNELCMLVVMNTASLQLIPTTVASLRAGLGSASPFDILPAVWLCSLLSVTAGVGAAKLFERFTGSGPVS